MINSLTHFKRYYGCVEDLPHERYLDVLGWHTENGEWQENRGPAELKIIARKNSTMFEKFKQYKWMDDDYNVLPLIYYMDKHGFRKFHNSEKESIVVLGCSDTFGVGLHVDQTWAFKLGLLVGKPVWNLGIPGAAQELNYESLLRKLPEMNVTDVFWLIPDPARVNLIRYSKEEGNYQRVQVGANRIPVELNKSKDYTNQDYFEDLRVSETKRFVDTQRNIDAVSNLCKRYSVRLHKVMNPFYIDHKIINTYCLDDDDYLKVTNWEKAYDQSHLGIPFHDSVSQYFFRKYQKKPVI